jgi:phosphoglycolate phosphatase-like HAD superfamily hydrolase
MEDILVSMKPAHDYLICVDSDGCVLDNMELKHKECFCPATVNIWELQGVSRYAREAAEHVNLYSRSRGSNRFPALVRTLELTYARQEVKDRGFTAPDLTPLKQWIRETPILSAAALEQYYRSHANLDTVLEQAARWSCEVDENIKHIVRHVPPFPFVREAFKQLGTFADIVVVSATPHDTLMREWREYELDKLVTVMAGQELGTKSECIRKAMTGRYAPNKVLKIGDAPGDYEAAMDNTVLFRPIIPGREIASWKQIFDESSFRFREDTYRGDYMDNLVGDFFSVLLETPPWIVKVADHKEQKNDS